MPVNIEKTNAGFGIIRHNLEQKLRESAAELFHPEGVDIWMEHPNRMLAGYVILPIENATVFLANLVNTMMYQLKTLASWAAV